jgi:simple sugar transport system ATP-binding protein
LGVPDIDPTRRSDQRQASLHSPKDAISGIGMMRNLQTIPVMTVAENVILANEPTTNALFLDHAAAEGRVRELASKFGFAIDPDALIQDISVGQQQRVEILKALYRGADILILDEPTAVLTPQEVATLGSGVHPPRHGDLHHTS